MELKTKYQYTYFIYPYLIEQKNYANYLRRLLKNKQCKLKLFDRKQNLEIDSYFLPEIKAKMFWSIDLRREGIKSYEKMDIRMKANLLSKQRCCFFDYDVKEDIPGKIGEAGGIFFDITKVQIVCFSTGICFLLLKTVLNEGATFPDVLNFNFKFRDIQSEIVKQKEYDNIKIQTNKFQDMQVFSDFLKQITGLNLKARKINLDTNRLITYAYACLDQESWNENTDIATIEKEFDKYRYIKPEGEQISDYDMQYKTVYQEKYMYYGFSGNSTVLLTSASNIKNYTKLLFKYENEELYHFIYHLHQKIYLKQLNYEFSKTKKFKVIQEDFLKFAKKDWIYEVTDDEKGVILEKYYKQAQKLNSTFDELKSKYDLLYKEYEIEKVNKNNRWIVAIIFIIMVINIAIFFNLK